MVFYRTDLYFAEQLTSLYILASEKFQGVFLLFCHKNRHFWYKNSSDLQISGGGARAPPAPPVATALIY